MPDSNEDKVPIEDKEQFKEVTYLMDEVFMPALQSAVKKALDGGYGQNAIFNASLYAFTNMLTMVLGNDQGTARLLRDFADHLEKSSSSSPSAEPGARVGL